MSLEHPEAHHADAGDRHAVEAQAPRHDPAPALVRRVAGGPEAVDHDLVAVRVVPQGLEIDLHLHADGEVVPCAREDRLHPWTLGQVDLGHAVPRHVGVLLAEQGHVAVGPGVDRPRRRQLGVLRALVQALGAHEPSREEHLAAGRAAAPEQARLLRRVLGDPEEPLLNGDTGHALLVSVGRACARYCDRHARCRARVRPSRDRAGAACRACRWGPGAWPP